MANYTLIQITAWRFAETGFWPMGRYTPAEQKAIQYIRTIFSFLSDIFQACLSLTRIWFRKLQEKHKLHSLFMYSMKAPGKAALEISEDDSEAKFHFKEKWSRMENTIPELRYVTRCRLSLILKAPYMRVVRQVIFVKEAMIVLGMEQRSVYRLTSRIRKKYNLPPRVNIPIDKFCEFTAISEERLNQILSEPGNN